MLEFTGERYIPGRGDPPIYYEHVHRYLFATLFTEGRAVLDVASGEGYGASWLADRAAHVVGVDSAQDAVEHAKGTYGHKRNLDFVVGDASRLPMPDDSIDLVVCFEAIEHVRDPEVVISEIRRVLRDDGTAILSTPNRKTYRDDIDFENPYHFREFYIPEFRELLSQRLGPCTLIGQKVIAASALWTLGVGDEPVALQVMSEPFDGAVRNTLEGLIEPLYTVAICGPEPPSPVSSLFIDRSEILMKEYLQRWAEVGRPGPADLERLEGELEEARASLAERERTLMDSEAGHEQAVREGMALRGQLEKTREERDALERRLRGLLTSPAWKLLTRLRRVRAALIPNGTRRGRLWHALLTRLAARWGSNSDSS